MSKQEKQTIYNVDRHVRRDSHTSEECAGLILSSQDKVAVAIGRQLLKRNLIKFETETIPGPNAGERRIVVKGEISVNIPKEE